MRAAALIVPAVVVSLLAPVAATADDKPASPAAATPSPTPSPTSRRLKLGVFADPYARVDDAALAELLRFYQHVEVEGKAPQDLQVAMEAWWDHFNFQKSVYGRGYNIQKPMANGAINILPLIDWLKKKVKENRRNKAAEVLDEPEP
jgi:hypothetical protein